MVGVVQWKAQSVKQVLVSACRETVSDWLVEQGLTSHSTQFRSEWTQWDEAKSGRL